MLYFLDIAELYPVIYRVETATLSIETFALLQLLVIPKAQIYSHVLS